MRTHRTTYEPPVTRSVVRRLPGCLYFFSRFLFTSTDNPPKSTREDLSSLKTCKTRRTPNHKPTASQDRETFQTLPVPSRCSWCHEAVHLRASGQEGFRELVQPEMKHQAVRLQLLCMAEKIGFKMSRRVDKVDP